MRTMTRFLWLLFAVALTLHFAGCRKKPSAPVDTLPPATQDGRNTLGFLLNGESWKPQGNNGTGSLDLYYDEGLQGGVFNLNAYRNLSTNNGSRQSLTLFGDSIQFAQKIILPNKKRIGFTFWDESKHCTYDSFDSTTKIESGYFDIKKLDKTNKIFSGEFEIIFTKQGCAEIQLTQGRFDMKY